MYCREWVIHRCWSQMGFKGGEVRVSGKYTQSLHIVEIHGG